MGGGHHHSWRPSEGFHPRAPPAIYRRQAVGLGATMWFWVFWRAKHDYKTVLVRFLPSCILSFYNYLFE